MSLLRRRMMMRQEEEDMNKWRKLGEVTIETPVNEAEIDIPEDISELILVITQSGGDENSESITVFAWCNQTDGCNAGNTYTQTTNRRAVARMRKITLESGEEYVDFMSVSDAAGIGGSGGGNAYHGNRLVAVTNNKVGVRKAATAQKLPAGFSFYILGR